MDRGLLGAITLLALFFFCVLGYLGVYAYSASKLEVRQVMVTDLRNISLDGADLAGFVELYNGGVISVSIDRVEYRLVMEDSKRELMSGTLIGGSIPAGESLNYTFTNRLNWAASADAAYKFLVSDKKTALIEGRVYVAKIGFIDLEIPFEQRIDLKNHINSYLQDMARQNLHPDLADQIPKDLLKQAGNLIKGLEKILT
jgi:hypothetical protein